MKDDEYFISHIRKTPEIKDQTKQRYYKYIKLVQDDIWPKCKSKRLCKSEKCCLAYILKHPEAFADKLNDYADKTKGRMGNKLGDHSRDLIMSSMMALWIRNQTLREKHYDLYKRWKDMHEMIRKPIDTKYKSNEPTERQRKGYISYDELLKIAKSLPEGSQERLLLMMYTEIPPVRCDYYSTRIYKTAKQAEKADVTENYIILSKKNPHLVLNNYKTAKKYKTITIDLPSTLVKEIEANIKKTPREYLFISNRTNEPYQYDNTFNQWVNRVLKSVTNKPDISLSMLRHVFISRRDLKLEEKSGLEQEKIARLMGHSIEQQRRYLWHTYLKEKSGDIKE